MPVQHVSFDVHSKEENEAIIRQPLIPAKNSIPNKNFKKRKIMPRIPVLEARTRILKSIITKRTGKCCDANVGDVLSNWFCWKY